MKLGLDFDGVLFDAGLLKKKLEEKYGDFRKTYHANKSEGVYNFREHCEDMGVEIGEFLDTVEDYASECLYEDVEVLDEIDCDKIIVTRGRRDFQEAKIKGSGILDYVDNYKIVEEYTSKDFDEVDILVDDTLEELYDFKGKKIFFDRSENKLKDVADAVKNMLAPKY